MAQANGDPQNPGFGTVLHNVTPRFTRALNARSIMSNMIPDMTMPDEYPYCIWHPQTADESTYRSLAIRYPNMKYQVARACAVGGYMKLYQELDILPDVHVAEEARDSGQTDIFDLIINSPVLYSVMNDYERTINECDAPSHSQLNGDTAVRSWLSDTRQELKGPFSIWDFDEWDEFGDHDAYFDGHRELYFNITEDQCVGEDTSPEVPVSPEIVSLLHTPLPRHLPNGNKDLLIFMAAFYGDIDRYVRLRRPKMQYEKERNCILRGIYHNTMFARWWFEELQLQKPHVQNEITQSNIMRAVMARFIMIDDLSRINDETPDKYLPYTIYYPCVAAAATYKELARRKPAMKEQIARACIIGNYRWVFDDLDVEPTYFLLREARDSPHRCYLETLERVMEERNLTCDPPSDDYGDWKRYTHTKMQERHTTIGKMILPQEISLSDMSTEWDWIYDRRNVDVSRIELFVAVAERLRQVADFGSWGGEWEVNRSYGTDDIPTALAKAKAALGRLSLNADKSTVASSTTEGDFVVREP